MIGERFLQKQAHMRHLFMASLVVEFFAVGSARGGVADFDDFSHKGALIIDGARYKDRGIVLNT